jgi:hypothetical protein
VLHRALEDQAGPGHSGTELAVELLAVPLAQADLQHRGHAVPIRGAEPTGREVSLADQVHVEHPDRPARGALGRKVVDIGYLDVVQQHHALHGAATPDDQIVALVRVQVDAGQGLQQPADVLSRARRPADLLVAEADRADRLLFLGGEEVGVDDRLLQLDGLLGKADRDRGDAVGADD